MITLKNNSKSFDERISNLRNKVMQNAITLRKKIKNGGEHNGDFNEEI